MFSIDKRVADVFRHHVAAVMAPDKSATEKENMRKRDFLIRLLGREQVIVVCHAVLRLCNDAT